MGRIQGRMSNTIGPPIQGGRFGELARLRQTGAVADYQRGFEQLLAMSEKMTKSQEVELYISGLQNPIQTDVAVQTSKLGCSYASGSDL